MYNQGNRRSNADNYTTSVGQTTHRRRLPSFDANCLRTDRPFPEGIREEQLSEYKVGAISHQG